MPLLYACRVTEVNQKTGSRLFSTSVTEFPKPSATGGDRPRREYGYRVGEAAKIVGVSATTIRAWEREGLVGSRRSASGYRYFDEADIAQLRRVAHLRKHDGLNTEGIRRILAAEDPRPEPRETVGVSLGARLRRLRQRKGMTLTQAGETAGLSPSFVSALERDLTGVAPPTLHRLVGAYGEPLSAVMRQEHPGLVQLLRPGKRQTIVMHGLDVEQLVNGDTLMDASIITIEAGAESAGSYSHEGEELLYVLDGVMEVSLATGERYVLRDGDSIYYPSTIDHEWRNVGTKALRVLWVCTPPSF